MKYYNGNNLKSNTDADMLMSVGGRGIGKTYWWKTDCIKRCIEKGEEWIYLRRYNSELKNVDLLLNDVAHLFPEYEFEIKRGRMFYKKSGEKNSKTMGYIMCLSRLKAGKGVNYPNVGTILFDEFQLDDTNKVANRYMPGEVNTFSDLYETISRDRDVRIIFLSNAISDVNPYYVSFKITPIANKITKFNRNGFIIAVEMVNSEEYMIEKRKTRSGRLMAITDMGVSSLDNINLNDSDSFIETKSSTSKFVYGFVSQNQMFGVFKDNKSNKIYIKKGGDPNARIYCSSTKDMNEKNVYLKSYKDSYDTIWLRENFKRNNVYFNSQAEKYSCVAFLTAIGGI